MNSLLRLRSAVKDEIDGTHVTAQLTKHFEEAVARKNVNAIKNANRALQERLTGRPYNGDPNLNARRDAAKARRDAAATADASMEGIEPGAKINILPVASILPGSTPMNINGGRRRNTRRRHTRRRNTRRRHTRRR